jgi:hypothetical protein
MTPVISGRTQEQGGNFGHCLIAKNASGSLLGSEPIAHPPNDTADSPQHALALTPEFQRLLDAFWPRGSTWIMVDTRRYIVYSSNAGVLGFISVSTDPM